MSGTVALATSLFSMPHCSSWDAHRRLWRPQFAVQFVEGGSEYGSAPSNKSRTPCLTARRIRHRNEYSTTAAQIVDRPRIRRSERIAEQIVDAPGKVQEIPEVQGEVPSRVVPQKRAAAHHRTICGCPSAAGCSSGAFFGAN